MRELTAQGVPFSMEYLSHNATKGVSSGVKVIDKCVLRSGYNNEQSDMSEVLVHYTNLDTNRPGIFYAPLLLKLNDKKLCDIKL